MVASRGPDCISRPCQRINRSVAAFQPQIKLGVSTWPPKGLKTHLHTEMLSAPPRFEPPQLPCAHKQTRSASGASANRLRGKGKLHVLMSGDVGGGIGVLREGSRARKRQRAERGDMFTKHSAGTELEFECLIFLECLLCSGSRNASGGICQSGRNSWPPVADWGQAEYEKGAPGGGGGVLSV